MLVGEKVVSAYHGKYCDIRVSAKVCMGGAGEHILGEDQKHDGIIGSS